MRRRPCSRAPPNSNPSAPTPTRPEIRASPGRQAHLSHTDADADALLWGCPLGRSLPRLPMGSRPGTVAARFSPDGGPPRQHPAVGVRGSIPRVGPAAGASPLLLRGFGLALRPLAASPPTPSPPTPRRRRQLHRRRRRRRRRPRRRGRRRRHPHPPWRVSSVQWSLVST